MRLGGVGDRDFANEGYETRTTVDNFLNLASTRFCLLAENAIGCGIANWGTEYPFETENEAWALTLVSIRLSIAVLSSHISLSSLRLCIRLNHTSRSLGEFAAMQAFIDASGIL